MNHLYAEAALIEAIEKANEARAAIHNAKTKKAKREAHEELEFWTNKKANLHAAMQSPA